MKCMNKVDIKECKAVCCGIVPIDKDIVEKHKDKLHKKAEKVADLGTVESWVYKKQCGFLNKRYRCKIYEDRPEICQLMGSEKVDPLLLKCSYLRQTEKIL